MTMTMSMKKGAQRGTTNLILAMFLSTAASAFAQEQAVDEQIIVGPVNVYRFSPPESDGEDFDVTHLNLRRVFEELGADTALWYQHVVTLSNPFFEGRAPGLEGNRHAADYIEFYFRELGLEPAFPDVNAETPGGAINEAWTSYRQPFSPVGRDTDNVGGVLRGRGSLADEWIIIGAHYDHVGYGNRKPLDHENGTLHPGADDNASGTSGMLILAQRFAEKYANTAATDLRSVLFMGFSAEEMGLLGSRHYIRNSTLDADHINIMINLDMIGRLRDDTLMIGGIGSADGLLDTITPHIRESGLKVHADPAGQGPSDHANFYGAGVPVLFMFTGVHSVYHQPGDFGYTMNPVGAARVIDLTGDIAWDFATRPERLNFTRVAGSSGGRRAGGNNDGNNDDNANRSERVSLGIMPDFRASPERGVMIGQVFEGGSAEAAGLKEGDIIIKWNGDAIDDVAALMRIVRDAKPGNTATLTIIRGTQEQDVKVDLKSRE